MNRDSTQRVGGGFKKVLYTLEQCRAMGVGRAARALTSKNACKACGLGMGGQRGGMTNELDEFPSVCNKSVQAQSTDVQPAIPDEIFLHSLDELAELSERELASLGRLNTPLLKREGENRYRPLNWHTALFIAAQRLRETPPERSFFYSSGRSSNEAGFVMQLLARLYGTNNVNNCSFYCHQATGVALKGIIGSGTATIQLRDLARTDLVFLVGANPASNHPRLLHQLKAIRDRGGEVIVINPAREPGLVRFAVPKSPGSLITGGSWIASEYLQPRIGSDRQLFIGIAKAVLEAGGRNRDFVRGHTDGYDEYSRTVEGVPWREITAATGLTRDAIEKVARLYCESERTVFAWGMGLTHHTHGVENIEALANLALLRGMVGKPGAGLLPLRGHSNVQGIGTIGVKPVLADDIVAAIEDHFGVSLPKRAGLDTMACMQAAARGDMQTALIMGGNLLASNPDTDWAARALARINTRIFLTTTLNRGHVADMGRGEVLVLPVTARDEEWQPTTQESMFNYVRLSDGGINRLDNVKPETWILAEIADMALGKELFDFTTFQRHRIVREAIAAVVPGMAKLTALDAGMGEFHIDGRLRHDTEFATPSGRAVFRPVAMPEAHEESLVMTTVRSEGQFNSIVYEDEDVYRGTSHRWVVMMNPDDMAERSLTAGDLVDLASDQGEMKHLEVVPFDLPRGNCMTYYPEANVLTAQAVDERSRTPAFKLTPVQLQKSH